MVKFYNPFQWHLIEYDNFYYVRRRSYWMLWWNYADRDFPKRWTWKEMRYDTRMYSFEDAVRILKVMRNPPKPKVIHGIPD